MAYDLVFSDCHVAPGQDLDRFKALGNMIVAEQPDNIICVGDMGTLDSCSYHDEIFGTIPGLREDRDSIKQALHYMFSPLEAYNERRRRNKKKMYEPNCILTKGNHEKRLANRMEDDPERLGSVIGDIDSYLGISLYFDRVVKYREWVEVNGIQYTHVPMTKMNRPMTGVHRGRKIALESSTHTIYGHTHTGDFTVAPLINGNGARCSLNLPAFMEEDYMEEYAETAQTGWTYGLCRVFPSHNHIKPFTYEWVSTQRLKEMYG